MRRMEIAFSFIPIGILSNFKAFSRTDYKPLADAHHSTFIVIFVAPHQDHQD